MSTHTAISPSPSKPNSLTETIRNVEQQISHFGPGPHNPKQKEDLAKLNVLLNRAKIEQSRTSKQTAISSEGNTPQLTGLSTMKPGTGQPVLDRKRLSDLVKEVDPLEQLDEDCEEVLMQLADDFIEDVVNSASKLAKHRKSNTIEAKDVQLHLERNWGIWVPGYGSEEIRPYRKAATTEAHKQRMALIRKTMKKY